MYVPGRLFSVNAVTAQHVPRSVRAQRTRVDAVRHGRRPIRAGAGGRAQCGQHGDRVGRRHHAGRAARSRRGFRRPPTTLEKGAELGRFNMGSTVILLFEPNRARWTPERAGGQRGAARPVHWAASRELAPDGRARRPAAAAPALLRCGARILRQARRARSRNADLERGRGQRSANRIARDPRRRDGRTALSLHLAGIRHEDACWRRAAATSTRSARCFATPSAAAGTTPSSP